MISDLPTPIERRRACTASRPDICTEAPELSSGALSDWALSRVLARNDSAQDAISVADRPAAQFWSSG